MTMFLRGRGRLRPRRSTAVARVRRVKRARAFVTSRLELLEPSTPGGEVTARFIIDRELASPNETLWKNRHVKIADRDEWGAVIFNAIVVHLEAGGRVLSILDRQVIANRRMPVVGADGRTVKRRLHRAPRQRYTVLITREVPKRANFIRDDDNLAFASKALRDALKAHCVIYEDSREWLTCPLPNQRVSADGLYRTIVDVTPWAPPAIPERTE